jgi:mannitol-1-phosphate 5-dehydrogenase
MPESAVMFGAGNVGRGFLGQLFSESGYEVVFVDIDERLIHTLKSRRAYVIRLVDNDSVEEVAVGPVRAVHAQETATIARALSETCIAATAVGVRALPQIAPLVAAGIARRSALGVQDPLNVIVCENLIDAAATFRAMVAERLDAADRAYLQEKIGFVDTVIGRMVPPPTAAMRAQDPSLIAVEAYKELPVDRAGFVGPVPSITGMMPCDNFPVFFARKLYIHNCGHAILGYLGYLRGHTYGYEALEDSAIRPLLVSALEEAKLGIVKAYDLESSWLEAHIVDVIRRLANRALGDTVFRLARDPIRKLGPTDRLVGAARLAENAGVSPQALSWGIAAGYCFDHPDDPLAMDLHRRVERAGLSAVMADVSGIGARERLADLVHARYLGLSSGQWP